MKLVDADTIHGAHRDQTKYYGAPCMPTVKGKLWECADRNEYNAMREAYEALEGNCNTCVHLQRIQTPKDPNGLLTGTCAARKRSPEALPFRFHPEDPDHLSCHVQRQRKTA